MAREIYRIKFGYHYVSSNDTEGYHKDRICTMYTIGMTGFVDGEMLTPLKITLKGDKVIVRFAELGIQHVFAYNPNDVELFYREKVKKNADKT